jgi:uncharacterized repeat protein (TIGR01451 family)
MKKIKSIRLFLFGAILMLSSSRGVYAAGTTAGTVISSRAVATYTTVSGANVDTAYSLFVAFIVKQGGAVNVLLPSLAKTSGDGLNVDYALTVLNSGNGTDKFSVTHFSSHGWQVLLYHDINGNGILDAADSNAGLIASTDSVKADSSFKIVARVVVPNNETLNGQSDSTVVTAASQFDPTKSAGSILKTNVQTALIVTNSSLSVDNAAPNPPGPITFTFSITNSGQSAATNVVVADLFDSRFSYVSSTNGGVHVSADSIQWAFASIAPGGSVGATFTVSLQASLLPGTVIPNTMNIVYNDGMLLRNKTSNTVNINIGNSFGVSLTPDSVAAAKEPSDSVKYYFTVKNTGTIKDVIELSAASSQPLAWTFLRDVNNNRVVDPADVPLTNTNGKAGVDVDSVSAGDSVHVFAIAIIPMVQQDQTKDVTTFTATSSGSALKFQSAVASTTTNIPVVSVAISVSPLPSQPQPPGGVLTYTISYSNNGHADIDTSYTVTARIPDSTSFVQGSAKLGTLSLPDSNAVRNGSVSIKTAGLKQSTAGTVEFKVKIN